MEMQKITGYRIKKYRNLRHLKQSDLAKLLEVSQTTIASWESNKQEPSQEKLSMLAKALKVSKEFLIGCDKKTQEMLKFLQKDEQIYNKDNYLTENEVTEITKLKNELNNYQLKISKSDVSLDNWADILDLERQIEDTILSNNKIREGLFDIDYAPQAFGLEETDVLGDKVVSTSQKNLFKIIEKLNSNECKQVVNFIYHLQHNTKPAELFNKMQFMSLEELDSLEAYMIGLDEQYESIKSIKEKYLNGENNETGN